MAKTYDCAESAIAFPFLPYSKIKLASVGDAGLGILKGMLFQDDFCLALFCDCPDEFGKNLDIFDILSVIGFFLVSTANYGLDFAFGEYRHTHVPEQREVVCWQTSFSYSFRTRESW
jgi:hypothetical protein